MNFDMTRPLVYGALGAMTTAMLFAFGMAAWQIVTAGEASKEVWALAAGVVGFVSGVAGTIYNFRFGSSTSSAIKNETINELSRKKDAT